MDLPQTLGRFASSCDSELWLPVPGGLHGVGVQEEGSALAMGVWDKGCCLCFSLASYGPG